MNLPNFPRIFSTKSVKPPIFPKSSASGFALSQKNAYLCEKYFTTMARSQYYKRMRLFLVFTIILLIMLCIVVVMAFRTGEEATVGIFSLAATLVGTVFIAMELKNSQDVTCSDMLIDLNNYFHESDRLMKVYEVLEDCQARNLTGAEPWKDVRSVEIAQYSTFFVNLYLLYRHHIASIEDLNDLFGYRFFLFMNNPYIQEQWILPTSSSYVQIFRL